MFAVPSPPFGGITLWYGYDCMSTANSAVPDYLRKSSEFKMIHLNEAVIFFQVTQAEHMPCLHDIHDQVLHKCK